MVPKSNQIDTMNAFDGEKELIFRMDERIGLISNEIVHIKNFLESKIVTKDMCALSQSHYEKTNQFQRIESFSKTFAMFSVAAGILWTIYKNS